PLRALTSCSLTLCLFFYFFLLLLPPPPRSTLFPYTTLFRSCRRRGDGRVLGGVGRVARHCRGGRQITRRRGGRRAIALVFGMVGDRKSTRLNSSHVKISYAVFCLKKKKNNKL